MVAEQSVAFIAESTSPETMIGELERVFETSDGDWGRA